ncbi:ECF transporter S component [Aerococcaceae bacterium 50-4]
MKKQYAFYAVTAALVVAISLFIIIPIPASNGFFTFADVGIVTASMIFGPIGGLVVGAMSGGLIDLLSGYAQWILFSAIIHGAQGYLAGLAKDKGRKEQVTYLLLSAFVMVIGYAIASWILYGTAAAAIAGLFTNILQSGIGILIAMPISIRLKPIVQRYL